MKLIFSDVLKVDYNLINDRELFQTIVDTKINYSDEEIPCNIHITPCNLLDENKIVQKVIKTGSWRGTPIIFINENPQIPFDLFSAVFYMVSRYEEYLPFVPDRHGRFEAGLSIAVDKGFLHLPVVVLWCKLLADELKIRNNCKGIDPVNYRFQLTIDVDRAWKYKNGGVFRTMAILMRDLIHFKLDAFKQKLKILQDKYPDPYYSFDDLAAIESQLQEKPRYFILCGKKSLYDNNIPPTNKHFQKLVNRLFKQSGLGLHPSYSSNNSFEILEDEFNTLENILGQKIFHSRQHFLKLTFPITYRRLIKLGILHDYTMGYSSQSGFRAGIARPYYFYDLAAEKPTDLRIVPFQIMDRTLLSYLNLGTEEAIKEINYYTETIKNVGGRLVVIWHNSSLSDENEWKGWRKVFEHLILLNKKDDTISSA